MRSVHLTQRCHSRLALRVERDLAYHVECLALKSGLTFDDLPPIPPDTWIYFHPPLAGRNGRLHYAHELHPSAEPMPKRAAIPLVDGAVGFALQLIEWGHALRTECVLLEGPLQRADEAPSCFGYRKAIPWEWSHAIVGVLQKWDCMAEREDELQRWVGGAKVWIAVRGCSEGGRRGVAGWK